MNLYDRIKPGKRRRGWGGAVFLAAACVVLVICIGTEETAKNPTGVFVRYTFADGTVYQYDTDQIQMNEVRLALGLH